MGGWLARAGGFTVEHVPCPFYCGKINAAAPSAGVMHTTEGSLESALAEFRQRFAPTFLVGPGRILQLIPFGWTGASLLEHNELARVQIEIVGFSQERPWAPTGTTRTALVALLRAMRDTQGIPLRRTLAENPGPKPWATTSNPRRSDADGFGKKAGWFGHIEVPDNDHWDPGWLQWATLLKAAAAGKVPVPLIKPLPDGFNAKAYYAWLNVLAHTKGRL